MKHKLLQIHQPCSESWEQMNSTSEGRFCEACSKTVFDLTSMSQSQISKFLRKSGNKVCARVTNDQLKRPLFVNSRSIDLNYPNGVAGVLLASALISSQPAAADGNLVKTEINPFFDTHRDGYQTESEPKSSNKNTHDHIAFNGSVTKLGTDDKRHPIYRAKITLVTATRYISAYSDKEGKFLMPIPVELLDDDNVIRVTYDDVEQNADSDSGFGYQTTDYLLSKKEIIDGFDIRADVIWVTAGGISIRTEKITEPIVLRNGVEVNYKQFVKAQMGKQSSCRLDNAEVDYFEPRFAKAIYKKASYGLYIIKDSGIR